MRQSDPEIYEEQSADADVNLKCRECDAKSNINVHIALLVTYRRVTLPSTTRIDDYCTANAMERTPE